MTPLPYYCNCVNWPRTDVDTEGGLCDMVDGAIEITRRTFLKHVNRKAHAVTEQSLGYSGHPRQGMTMAQDYAVSYHRGKLHGRRVYYFRHSAIEYVYAEGGR